MKFRKFIAPIVAAAILTVSACGSEPRKVAEVSAELKGTVLDNYGYGLTLYDEDTQKTITDKFSNYFKGAMSFGDSVFSFAKYRYSLNTDIYSTLDDTEGYESFQTEMLSYYFDTTGHWANEETRMYSDGSLSWCAVISELTQKPVLVVMTDEYFVTGELAAIILMQKLESYSDIPMNDYLDFYNAQLEKAGYESVGWQLPKEG